MSKKLAKRQSTELSAETQEALQKKLATVRDRVEVGGGRMIRTKGKRFTFPDGTKVNEPLEVVIIEFMAWNLYFDEPYDEDNPIPPVCYAFNERPKDMTPSPNCKEMQIGADELCKGCHWNKFGSAPNGKGKACQNRRLFALLPANADEEDEMMLMSASPTSVSGFDAYVTQLSSDGELPISVITEIDFDDDVDYPKLTFSKIDDNPDVDYYFKYSAAAVDLLTREPQYEEEGEEETPAKKAAPKKKAATKKKVAAKKAAARRR